VDNVSTFLKIQEKANQAARCAQSDRLLIYRHGCQPSPWLDIVMHLGHSFKACKTDPLMAVKGSKTITLALEEKKQFVPAS